MSLEDCVRCGILYINSRARDADASPAIERPSRSACDARVLTWNLLAAASEAID